MTRPEFEAAQDAGAAVKRAAEVWAESAHRSVRERGVFRVALSGGKTPKALFFLLAGAEYGDLPWRATEFYWADERYVPPSHPESNFRAARDLLLSKVPGDAGKVHRVPTGAGDPVKDAERYAGALMTRIGPGAGGFPELDLVLLGLGADGHTASLFPGTPAAGERKAWAVAARAPIPVRDRITLTVPVLNNARRALMLATGKDKAAAVRELKEGDLPDFEFPAKLIRPRSGPLLVLTDQV